MSRNIEIKARASNFTEQLKLAEQISDQALVTLVQEDTFFNVADGRLKLREFPDAKANLIFYHRVNTSGPKLSDYHITEIDDAGGLKSVLLKAYGVRHVVKKVRSLYMFGRTRLHFDAVEGLGDFIELEVVLDEHDSIESGEAEAERLMLHLNIQVSELIDVAYVDLLEQQTA
ncbi:MAG: putative adenylyl cyclase CyaB [Arenicella sp.]|jgi:predicted adenylyl cyclase CyaB